MKVLIVAKTRQGAGACIGGITFDGRSVRLLAANAATHERAGMNYEIAEVWEVEATPPVEFIPPHIENLVVGRKQRLGLMSSAEQFIERHSPGLAGGCEVLFEGLTQATTGGALYIAERVGIPSFSTHFWRPDKALQRDDDGKRIRYRYPAADGGRTVTFVGFQEPVEVIPGGSLLRVSLAHWWRPEPMSEGEYRCYVQLSGWFLDGAPTVIEGRPASAVARTLPLPEQASQLLKSVFGYDHFLPLQADIIVNVLDRRDTLAIMPTGSGKSLCYQLPALLFEGLTVVVSPLIALMQDQVDALQDMDVPALFLNSTLDYSEYLRRVRQIKEGAVKLLYVSPETLLRPETLVMLDQCNVDCLAIDEAHCISSWGHDFRPEYRELMPVRERYSQAVCIALTATATQRVRSDIESILGFDSSDQFVAGFDRGNLFLVVRARLDGLQQVLTFLDTHRDQSGIIYCSTRKQVEVLVNQLEMSGYQAVPYHAGLDRAVRLRHQHLFSHDDVPIIVATVAFGMGIDKSNVRFILHYNLPKNLESYYQEIGRAGRDGLRADCLLLYGQQDVGTIHHFIEQGAASERAGATARLSAMLRYAQTRNCRRRPLLNYFGDAYDEPNCGHCDNCLAEEVSIEQEDVTIAAQKFLSCILRTRELFGATHIVNILRGSSAKTVLNRGHDNLSTYGIGTEYSAKHWRRLAQQFIEQGLLDQDMQHGSLRVTPAGRRVLAGKDKVHVAVEAEQRSVSDTQLANKYDGVLFEELRVLRKQLADAANIPPFVVFSDHSLMEMATFFPQTTGGFLAIHGVGDRKLERYGDAFIAVIQAYCTEHDLEERPPTARFSPSSTAPSTKKRRYEEVGELLAAGHSIEYLQALYDVKRRTIINNLERYLSDGHDLSSDQLLASCSLPLETQEEVLAAFTELGTEWLRPVYDRLGGRVAFDDLQLLRLYLLYQDV